MVKPLLTYCVGKVQNKLGDAPTIMGQGKTIS